MLICSRLMLALVLITLVMAPGTVRAQTVINFVDDLDFDRPEAWAMKYFTSLALLTGLGAPRTLEPGSIEIGFEGGYIPSLSDDEQRVGFNGTKLEDLNRSSVFGRGRVTFGLPQSFSLTLGWAPPVDVGGIEPNLFSVAIGRPLIEKETWRLGLRLFGQVGTLEGDITCPEDVAASNDPAINPFGCLEASNDEVTQDYAGLEVSAAWQTSPRFEPHVAVALNYLDMENQVDARYLTFLDRSLLRADGYTWSVTAGLTWKVGDKLRLAGEVFYSPLDIVRPPRTSSRNEELLNVRTMLSYRIR